MSTHRLLCLFATTCSTANLEHIYVVRVIPTLSSVTNVTFPYSITAYWATFNALSYAIKRVQQLCNLKIDILFRRTLKNCTSVNCEVSWAWLHRTWRQVLHSLATFHFQQLSTQVNISNVATKTQHVAGSCQDTENEELSWRQLCHYQIIVANFATLCHHWKRRVVMIPNLSSPEALTDMFSCWQLTVSPGATKLILNQFALVPVAKIFRLGRPCVKTISNLAVSRSNFV